MKTFPTIVTGIFVALALGAVIIFATYSSSSQNTIGAITIWGTLPHSVFDELLGELGKGNNDYTAVTYEVVPEVELVPRLVEAIASGKGPDLVVFPAKNLLSQADKLQPISYSSIPRRDFQNTFIQSGETFLRPSGIIGLPFTVDPLVMYWNRAIFDKAGIANPPTYWDEISAFTPKLTKADKDATLIESTVAFGTWSNVTNAKEILLSLLNQLGDPVVALNDKGVYQSVLSQGNGGPTSPADSALRFYTDFSDPVKPAYSWNRSQPSSHDAFIAGTLAIYFGFASELSGLRAANPNLNFDVAQLPVVRGGGQGAYANVLALSIPRGAANPSGALLVAESLTSLASQEILSGITRLPSVRRDVSPSNRADPYSVVFRNAALNSFAFLDPDPSPSDAIFARMVDKVSSGKLQVSEATQAADQELSALLGVQ
ncbi:extracellular solute-binding protein [Candidatus Kaiserbacteria bacterium]|nr:extracellular solute-binding protein [Candidatus Kaiserbacteria bacterium]